MSYDSTDTFFNNTATTVFYTLSLHDALPILGGPTRRTVAPSVRSTCRFERATRLWSTSPTIATDRKSTRLNSSHQIISYAVFCLKKKKILHTRSISPPSLHNYTST